MNGYADCAVCGAAADCPCAPPDVFAHLDVCPHRPTKAQPWHGTLGGYTNHRCRCEPCRRVWAEYHRHYRAKTSVRTRKVLENERTAQTREP